MTFAGKVLFTSISLLINMHANKFQEQDKLNSFPIDSVDLDLPFKERFDFIIVGAGTAGCIVARRLADAHFKVLLLEAGGNPPPLLNVPFATASIQSSSELHFLFHQVLVQRITSRVGSSQYSEALFKNFKTAKSKILTGNIMGGSSSINDMQYERGSLHTYNQWGKATNDKTWKYDHIFKYFEKLEDHLGISMKGNCVEDEKLNLTLGQQIWFNAGKELGYWIFCSNVSQSVEGFNKLRFTQENGMRVSTYAAFIKTVEETRKPFLEIRRYSVVSKILFEGKRASGVYYTRHGVPRVASAMKEVVICAGTFMTPIILINSGIGSKNQLQAANIEQPLAILPEVGRNLLDHPTVEIDFENDLRFWNSQQNITFEDVEAFFTSKNGPLTNPHSGKLGEAFVVSNRSTIDVDWPDLQVLFDSAKCSVRLTRPHSRGLLKFNSSARGMDDPFLVTADFRFFKEDSDIDAIIQGIEFCLKIVENTESFQKIGAKIVRKSLPQCDHEEFKSKAYWKCFLTHTTNFSNNAVGTCRMGKKYELDPPRSSVVDHKLRVHDVENLRIVDASVMPTIPNANVAAATMIIAEKASAIIIKHHCRKNEKLCKQKRCVKL